MTLLTTPAAERPVASRPPKAEQAVAEVVFRLSEGLPEAEAVAKIARPPAETLDVTIVAADWGYACP